MKLMNRGLAFTILCAVVLLFAPRGYSAGRVTGFESGDPPIAHTVGDAGAVGSFESVAPVELDQQFLITTISSMDGDMLSPIFGDAGLNNSLQTLFFGTALPGQEGSGLLVPFTVTTGDAFLTFNYDFLTNENGPGYHNDIAFYALFSDSTNLLGSYTRIIDASTAAPLSPLSNGPFVLHTGYNSYSIDVSGLAPGNYNLGIGVEDVMTVDNPSGLLIDNVQILAAVPEPSVAALTIAGALLLLVIRSRLKSF